METRGGKLGELEHPSTVGDYQVWTAGGVAVAFTSSGSDCHFA